MTEEAPPELKYAPATVHVWSRLLNAVALVGLGVGVARIINGGFSIWESAVFERGPWVDPVARSPFLLVGGLIAIVLGGALIAASIGCLRRLGWGWVLLLLVEQCAILLLVLTQLLALVKYAPEIVRSDSPVRYAGIELADMFARLMMPAAYSILAIAIVRQNDVRECFRSDDDESGPARVAPRPS
jgi:hypothetical protein